MLTGILKGYNEILEAHLVEQYGKQGYGYERHYTGVPEVFEVPVYIRISQNVLYMEYKGFAVYDIAHAKLGYTT